MGDQSQLARFDQAVLPHLRAAYNLARWMTHDDQDAEDVVQEACVRAFRFIGGFHGGDSRAWLLRIVRNTCYTWLQQNRAQELMLPYDEERHGLPGDALNPEAILLQNIDHQLLRQAVEELPTEFREVMILRDVEGLSYREIAEIVNVPLGTVMSRLARARKRLQQSLTARMDKEFELGL